MSPDPRPVHLDTISIDGLELDCVVGVHRHERDQPQRLSVDVSLHLDTEAAGASGKISRTVDYQQLASQIVFLLQSSRFQLIETAARAIARHLLAPPLPDEIRPAVVSARIRLSKPQALDGRAVPSITIERDASWARLARRELEYGSMDMIHESQEVAIYRLNLAPGARVEVNETAAMAEAEMVLGDGLRCQGKGSPPGTIHRWPKKAQHIFENVGATTRSILCVDTRLAAERRGEPEAGSMGRD